MGTRSGVIFFCEIPVSSCAMGQTAHHYLIFETAGGFCSIAWNKLGITRFQLPTKSAEMTGIAAAHEAGSGIVSRRRESVMLYER